MKLLLDLRERECRWPVATAAGTHLFCGAPIEAALPVTCSYCFEHFKKSHVPTNLFDDRHGEKAADSLTRGERIANPNRGDSYPDLVEVMGDDA